MLLAEDLKKAVLQAALQGKLTTQLESDSDVDDLIAKFKSEKKVLAQKKNARTDKDFGNIEEDEVEFDIPESWRWVRLGDIGVYKKGPFGSAITKSMFVPKSSNAVKVYEQKNAIQKDASLGEYYISKEYYENKMSGFRVDSGDIIVSCAGTIGETYIMPDNIELGIINQALMRMNIVESINVEYFLYYFDHILKTNAKRSSNGSAIKNIPPFEVFKRMLLPVPPIEEQQRIVEKLDAILLQIDAYGEAEKELELLQSVFPDDIRKSILQYAMRGKLVEQCPEEGSGEELYQQIQEKKKVLIKDGIIRKEKTLAEISEDEIPFSIPDTWKWIRLRDVCTKIVDGDHNPPAGVNKATEWLMLSAQNINNNKIVDIDRVRYLSKELFEKENLRTRAQKGDIFFTIVGTLGRSCVFDGSLNVTFQRSVSVISTEIYNKYLKYALDAPYIQQYMIVNATGTAQKGFYLNQVENLIIPLPPLKEQERIVNRLESIMSIIDG